MYWTLELASYLSDAPWPATKDELIDFSIRTGAPLEVVENLQSMEDEGDVYESIEEIDPKQVEAIKATGGSRAQQMIYGIVPQILPTIAGVGVFRWDINVRGSTILGIVGAGGIGIQLSGSINVLAWTQVSTILIVILGTVFVSEYISAKVRGAII